WRLSTNVVTRPIMQELIFPTLAFVAGDGEISYWGALKSAFETVGIKMPPVVPRLSITFITDRISKLLYKRALKAEDVIRTGKIGRASCRERVYSTGVAVPVKKKIRVTTIAFITKLSD